MIKDSIDFDYAINKIIADLNLDIKYQDNTLNSSNINHSFTEIENGLNILYEKTRYLEDSIQYAKVFLDTKSREFHEEMDDIIKELDNTMDMTKNLAYMSHNVPLIENTSVTTDRDGSVLYPLIVNDGKLTLPLSTNEDIDFTIVKTLSDYVPYNNTIENFISTKEYKTIFIEEKAIKNGLTETVTLYFGEPKTINYINIKASNCNIKNIRFGLINGVEEYAHDYNIETINKPRTCIYLKFDLVCTNYSTVYYELDKRTITENLWDELKDFESSKSIGLDKITKLNADYIISRTTKTSNAGSVREAYSPTPNDVMTVAMYTYVFGIDSIEIKNIIKRDCGYFISKDISIGKLNELEYITLNVSHSIPENCSIEYSILDQGIELPIIPIGTSLITNERIFSIADTRFLRDSDKTASSYVSELVKKDGQETTISYEKAKTLSDGKYTLTYKPNVTYHERQPINNQVQVKCCIRTFGPGIQETPYIDMITIRKFGEEALWINKF